MNIIGNMYASFIKDSGNDIFKTAKEHINRLFFVEKKEESDFEEIEVVIDSNFKLPIEYLDSKYVKKLPENVSNDLELINTVDKESKPMYDFLLQPDDTFSKQMTANYNQFITTDVDFLYQTQDLITSMKTYKENIGDLRNKTNTSSMLKIWKNTKENPHFLEKYNYMEWDMLKYLNKDSTFLQALFYVHMASPVIQFCLPLLFFIFPFIILKISGTPISVSEYLKTLKFIAQQHSVGKILMNIGHLEWDKLVYLIFTIGMYIFQTYQNVNLCLRFYNNVLAVNKDLISLKNYVNYSIQSMTQLMTHSENMDKYSEFNASVHHYRSVLESLQSELSSITPFKFSLYKINDVGYMLKMYYLLHSNKEYEDALVYSMGFEGYTNNLCKLHNFIENNTLSFANFNDNNSCEFKSMYYPAILDSKPVKNNVSMKKNMIISAPNKAGKTTLIKNMMMNIIFTQQFGCGFYKSADIDPFSYIHSYLNIPDTSGRDSLFQAESRRCKEIIDTINKHEDERHFCIFDELYSGTNPEEAVQAGKAFIEYISKHTNVNFILTTHYKQICTSFKKSKHVDNYKMNVLVNKDGLFDYKYKLVKGISEIKGGIRILKDMEYPQEILENIET